MRHGETGKPWRGIDVTAKGRHWAYPPSELDKMDAAGKIHWPKKEGGMPMQKRYAKDQPGVPLQDVWTDIPPMHNLSAERLGYPTQKPEGLLERMILASSNEGDVVLDPFCGCGTAIAVAQKLHRVWIGIDVTCLATALIKNRLATAFGKVEFKVLGEPTTLTEAQSLADQDKYQFQCWALGLVDARPIELKKGADKGIDGRLYFHDEKGDTGKTKQIILSVKGGKTSSPHVRDLVGVVEREKAAIGVLISMQEPTRDMRGEAAAAGFYEAWNGDKHPKIQLLTIEELLDGKTIDAPRWREKRTFKAAPKVKRKSTDRQTGFLD